MTGLFVSYSRDDTLAMNVIRDNLRKLGFNLWIDLEHLPPGAEQWMCSIKHAVGESDGMLVLCSPSAEKSEWVNREIHMAQTAGKPVIPVLIAGEEWESIPAALMGNQYCDMRGRANPEQGFQKLVMWLSERFEFSVPDYELDASGSVQLPTVQVINIQGHVEGHVIAIGRDVAGDVSIAGGDIRQEGQRAEQPAPTVPPAPEPQLASREEPSSFRRWLIVAILGLIGLAIVVGGYFGLKALISTLLAKTGVANNIDWKPVSAEKNDVEMVLVPAGCFEMGSIDGDDDEQPVHRVCFDDPYWLDAYEVTNAEFAAFLNSAGSQPEGDEAWFDESAGDAHISESGGTWSVDGGYENHPVVEVTWYGASAYCEWRDARLPTEAEWEFAARGPDGSAYPWGMAFDCSRGNFDDETVSDSYTVPAGPACDGYNQTSPVGSFESGASWVGAYDLSGNVWEWVNDWYAAGYYATLANGEVNPQGPGSGEYRGLRGGSWEESYSGYLRAADRYCELPATAINNVGFRCARSY
ncbi:MAG: SUMF1/EgtB/PvdO family nonheme iron enzyme [Anaerolineae bacterium]|nr:SUMF1/EgtB/PvdO family nonheme iron enzyme [Anaerolineae bacterium]